MSKPKITLESTVQKQETVISADLEEAIVMMDIEKGQYYSLNEVGSKIWDMLTEPIQVHAICENLMTDFDVSAEVCQQEVLAYLTELLELGIISIA